VIFLLTVLCLGLILRLSLAYYFQDSFLDRGNRSSSIKVIADNLIRHHEFSLAPGEPTAVNEPLYTLFVSIIFYLFGKHWLTLAFFQSLISLLNALLIYQVAISVFKTRRAAQIAFTLCVFYPFYVTQSISISDTVFFSFWVCLSTFLTVIASSSGEKLHSSLAGISWGLTLLTRFSAIGLFPFALLYLFLRQDGNLALRKSALITMLCILTLSPWVYRNYALTGRLFVTTHGAVEFWYAYNDQTADVLSNDVSVDIFRRDLKEKIPEFKPIHNDQGLNSIAREVAISEVVIRDALAFIQTNPLESIKMIPLKLWKFWSWNKNPKTNSLKVNRSQTDRLWDLVYTISYSPVLLLAILGMYQARKSFRKHSIFICLFTGYSILHALIYGFTRLRVPLDQFLMIYAAAALVQLALFVRSWRTAGPSSTLRGAL